VSVAGRESRLTAGRIAAGLIVATLLVAGPPFGVDVVSSGDERLGEGTANATVVQSAGDGIRVTEGRFGTGVWYVRLPDLVVDVERYRGQPRVQYAIAVPELGVDRTETTLVTSTGRLRIPVDDKALAERPANASYRGTVRVRVQSFSAERTLLDRTVEVTVE